MMIGPGKSLSSVKVGNDRGKVIIEFPPNVRWVGFEPHEAEQLANMISFEAKKAKGLRI